MKKLLAVLLMMTLSTSLLIGCTGKESTDNGNDAAVNQEADVNLDEAESEIETEPETTEPAVDNAAIPASEWLNGKIQIDGVVYDFPIEAATLAENGWTMATKFPVPARPGSNALIYFEKGDLRLETNVTSIVGTEVPMEEGAVSSIHYWTDGSNKDISMEFPGGVTLGTSKADVEKVLPSEFEYDAEFKRFKYFQEGDMGDLDIKIILSEDESVVTEISYTYWTESL